MRRSCTWTVCAQIRARMPTGSTSEARCRPASTTLRSRTSPPSTCSAGRRGEGQGGVYGLPAAEVDRLTARANGSGPHEDVRTPNYLNRVSARANVDFHVSPRADVSLATGYLSSAVRMPLNDNNILGVLPSGFLGFGDSTINDGWGFFPPGDVFQIRTSQAVERLTGSLRGTWRPLSFLA